MTEGFVVQVDADQFDRFARPTQPLAGITELLWNALDAEADVVTVAILRTEPGGVDVLQVMDEALPAPTYVVKVSVEAIFDQSVEPNAGSRSPQQSSTKSPRTVVNPLRPARTVWEVGPMTRTYIPRKARNFC